MDDAGGLAKTCPAMGGSEVGCGSRCNMAILSFRPESVT